MVKLVVNGVGIEADESKTILEVVRENQLGDIPTLCQLRDLDPNKSCGICVVEIEGAPDLQQACAAKVKEGMVVNTESNAITAQRKARLESFLSTHKADCFAPCRIKCPANVDIQGYIALGLRGQYTEAAKLMKETNPLPMVCGKVCAKPCETACRRNFIDEPVDIKNIKRFIAKMDLENDGKYYVPTTGPDTGKKVAIVGSGPAGLTVAFFLRKKGHQVKIFEMAPKAGGMLRYGIPEYRLPKADLQEEIDSILSMGVDIEFNTKLGRQCRQIWRHIRIVSDCRR